MPSYNLTKRADRKQYRKDLQEELDAVEQKKWPRDLNDYMRWVHCPTGKDLVVHAGEMCRTMIESLNDIEMRLSTNDPSLEGWER